MEIEYCKPSDLKPHPKNPRIHPDSAIEKLMKSIGEFGFVNPILISKDNYILAGHSRFKAAKKLGLKKVPVIRLDLSGEKAMAYMMADNKLAELSEWDFPLLEDVFNDLKLADIDLQLTGFDLTKIEDVFGNGKKQPDIITIPEKYEILITDIDESTQVKLLTRFQKEGLKCKALIS